MKASDVIRSIMQEKGITQKHLAKMLGWKRQTNVSAALQSDMKASRLVLLANVLGYDVILRERERETPLDERKITVPPEKISN